MTLKEEAWYSFFQKNTRPEEGHLFWIRITDVEEPYKISEITELTELGLISGLEDGNKTIFHASDILSLEEVKK